MIDALVQCLKPSRLGCSGKKYNNAPFTIQSISLIFFSKTENAKNIFQKSKEKMKIIFRKYEIQKVKMHKTN